MVRRSALTLVGIVLILSIHSCGRAFQQPEVALQSVQLAGLGLRGGTLMVNLEITNPNRFSLTANELDYLISIAQTETAGDTTWFDLASGTHAESFTVGASDTGTLQVPVEFTYSGLGGAAASLLRAGTFNYRAIGTVDVRTPVGSFDVPFRRGGTVTLLNGR